MAKEATKKESSAPAVVPGYVPRLRQVYLDEAVPKLQKEFDIENVVAVPGLEKIVLNMGLGEATQNIKILDGAVEELAAIAGQRPVITRARKSIAAFKLREGVPIGCRVTLRGPRMWEFLDRLISTALPRVRDFRGVPPTSFDGRGNYTLGIKDHLVFPDLDYDKVDTPKGLNVTIVTTAENDEQAFYLLRELGMPFARPRAAQASEETSQPLSPEELREQMVASGAAEPREEKETEETGETGETEETEETES